MHVKNEHKSQRILVFTRRTWERRNCTSLTCVDKWTWNVITCEQCKKGMYEDVCMDAEAQREVLTLRLSCATLWRGWEFLLAWSISSPSFCQQLPVCFITSYTKRNYDMSIKNLCTANNHSSQNKAQSKGSSRVPRILKCPKHWNRFSLVPFGQQKQLVKWSSVYNAWRIKQAVTGN